MDIRLLEKKEEEEEALLLWPEASNKSRKWVGKPL